MADVTPASIESLLKKLCNNNAEVNHKVDGYSTLFSNFQQEKDFVTILMKTYINKLLAVLQIDVKHSNIALAESALSVMGQCLASEEILKHSDVLLITKTIQALCSNLESQENKSVCIRTLWCFTNQHISPDNIKEYVPIVVEQFMKLSSNKKQKSELIICEGLRTMRRFCEQCPSKMEELAKIWFIDLFSYVLSEVPKIRNCTLELIQASMGLLLNQQEFLSCYLLEQLNHGNLSETLKASFEQGSCPVHVLNTWACVLRLLGKLFFELNRVSVLNPLLKIAEKSFASTNCEVSLALTNMWRTLIDVVFLVPGGFSKRMEKIFLLPIQMKYRNEVVANENLKTNWHLICNINENVNSFVEKLILPLLYVYLSTESTDKPVLESPNAGPEQIVRRRSRNHIPYVFSTSTKLLAAEILIQLLTKHEDRIKTKSLKLELFKGPVLNEANLVNHFPKIFSFVMNATESYSTSNENDVTQLWTALFSAFRDISHEGDHFKSLWKELLLGIKKVWEHSTSSVIFIMKVLLIVPEATLHLRLPDFQCQTNDAGLTSLFIIGMLLHKKMFENGGLEQERYFILFERMISVLFKGINNQLQSIQFVFTMLVHAVKKIKSDDICWRLWSTICCLLEEYICRTGDVNQGGSLNYEFPTLLDALVFPLKNIALNKLNEGTKKELLKVWTELYRAFSRSVNLLPGVEVNLALEEFFAYVHTYVSTLLNGFINDAKSLNILIEMGFVSLGSVDWSDSLLSLTPSKLNKKRKNPLANFRSFANIIIFLLNQISQKLEKGESCGYEKCFLRLLDLIEKFYVSVNNSSLLADWSHALVPSLSTVLSSCLKYSNKVNMNTEKLISTIFSTFEITSQSVFHSDLLRFLEPLLIECFKSERKSLRLRAAKFWNSTFAKSANLDYSDALKDTFLKHSAKVHLILPNFIDRVPSPDLHEDTMQFSNTSLVASSPSLKHKSPCVVSPVKVFGSFLRDTNSPLLKKSPVKKLFHSPSRLKESCTKITAKSSIDFIEICESPKRRRLLTEHQKEKLRERHNFPAMYNSLDQSQDTTLLNSLTQDTGSQTSSLLQQHFEIDRGTNDIAKNENKVGFDEPFKNFNQLHEGTGITSFLKNTNFCDTKFLFNSVGKNEAVLETKNAEPVLIDPLLDNATDTLSPEVILSSQALSQSPVNMKLSILSPAAMLKNDPQSLTVKQAVDKEDHKNIDSGRSYLCRDKEWLTTGKSISKTYEIRSKKLSKTKKIKKVENFERIKESKLNCLQSVKTVTEDKISDQSSNQFLDKLKSTCDLNILKPPEPKLFLNKVGSNERAKRKRGKLTLSQNKRKKPDLIFNKKHETLCDQKLNFNSPLEIQIEKKDASSFMEKIHLDNNLNYDYFGFSQNLKQEDLEKCDSIFEHKADQIVMQNNDIGNNLYLPLASDIADKKDGVNYAGYELTKRNTGFESMETGLLVPNVSMETGLLNVSKTACDNFEGIFEEVNSPTHLQIAKKSSSSLLLSSCSPVCQVVFSQSSCLSSPTASPNLSPANGILKKKLNHDMPSPPISKSRHVTFQLPQGTSDIKDDLKDLAKPLDDASNKGYTLVKKKNEFSKSSAIYPQLATCSAPIEKILPSLTFSRGIGHLVRAQNILTIGDLSSLTEMQIENLPIRSPKVTTVRNALRTFAKGKSLPKSPLIIKPSTEHSTPPKDEKSLTEEAFLLTTPSRHFDNVKPTLLFSDVAETVNRRERSNQNNLYEMIATSLNETPEVVAKEEKENSIQTIFESKVASPVHTQVSEELLTNEVMLGPKTDLLKQTVAHDELIHAPKTDSFSQTELQNELTVASKFGLTEIKMSALNICDIFELVSQLDFLKTKAMEELKARCSVNL